MRSPFSAVTSKSSCSTSSRSYTSRKRRLVRGRWYSTVSRLTSRKTSFRNSQARFRSRRWMRRTRTSGVGGAGRGGGGGGPPHGGGEQTGGGGGGGGGVAGGPGGSSFTGEGSRGRK